MRAIKARGIWLAATVVLLIALLWLDQNRGGPAGLLSRCNLLLSRSAAPAADVLIVGSSRTGAALDPVAMQQMLAQSYPEASLEVERIALGYNPLRVNHALLENYLEVRGAPRVVVLEITLLTKRSVERLAQRRLGLAPEKYIFRRDVNLMTFGQVLRTPSVAMPFSESEGSLNLWRFRLRGVVIRAGALIYQFFRHPIDSWQLSECDRDAWTREPGWPSDFAFSYGEFSATEPPREVIQSVESSMLAAAKNRELKPWQLGVPTGQRYPYDFGASYRAGEVAMLRSMLDMASTRDIPVVLLPLPIYGYEPAADDMHALADTLPEQVQIFDLYGRVKADLGKFWYDDAHIERVHASTLTTAILARHLVDRQVLTGEQTKPAND